MSGWLIQSPGEIIICCLAPALLIYIVLVLLCPLPNHIIKFCVNSWKYIWFACAGITYALPSEPRSSAPFLCMNLRMAFFFFLSNSLCCIACASIKKKNGHWNGHGDCSAHLSTDNCEGAQRNLAKSEFIPQMAECHGIFKNVYLLPRLSSETEVVIGLPQ